LSDTCAGLGLRARARRVRVRAGVRVWVRARVRVERHLEGAGVDQLARHDVAAEERAWLG